jgi:PAS domain S-box-containing protein
MALNVLSGNSIEKMQSHYSENFNYVFDYRQLKRWSISNSELPVNSEIRFVEYTFWEKYIYRIMLIISVFVILLIIIGYLLAQKRILRKSQKELSQAERKYKTVADYTYDWEYWQNPDGSMAWVSPSCEHICGYSRALITGDPTLITDMIRQEDKKIWDIHNCNDNGRIDKKGIRFRIRTKQGEVRWIEHTCRQVIDEQGNNLGIRANNRDITERERYKSQTSKLQSELIHVERVATISALTYTLAHEINQPLTSIRSYAQAALRFMHNDRDERVNIEKALQGIVSDNKRAAAVVNQLRDLVKNKDVETQVIDINKIIKDVLRFLKSELVIRNTRIKLTLDNKIATVNADPIQLQQVLLNLITNGLDAMEGLKAEKKVLTISTSAENSTGSLISIADAGTGISEEKLEEIFEPFHTSKSDGIGLGLAISKSIIENHGGKIWAENNASEGAKFLVLLPVVN